MAQLVYYSTLLSLMESVFSLELPAPIRKRVVCLVWWVTGTIWKIVGKNDWKIQVMSHMRRMHGIFFYIYHKIEPNVGRYSTHSAHLGTFKKNILHR